MGPTRKLREDEVAERKQQEVMEKDRTELELEQLLFGDQAGFLDSLKQDQDAQSLALQKVDEDGEHEDTDMQDVPDQDLFFLDSGTTDLPDGVKQDLLADAASSSDDEDDDQDMRVSLWHDSDDDRLTISLASHTRLRKLRDTEEDDLITGTEYIRRLRRQYKRLHPTPAWATQARKRLKTSNGHNQDSDSDQDPDIDIESAPTQSLSDLLRTAGALSHQPTSPRSSRKFRPEVIDIQRTKDVLSNHPSSIDALQFHPTHPLLLTGGPSSTLSLFHLSPDAQNPNPLISSIHIKHNPLHTAGFCVDPTSDLTSTRIFLSSRRPYYHTYNPTTTTLQRITRPLYDSTPQFKLHNTTTKPPKPHRDLRSTEHFLISPNSHLIAFRGTSKSSGGSNIHILSTTTHQHLASTRIDSSNGIADFAWWRNSGGLSIVGKNGEVSEFSMTEKRVLGRWIDEGAVGTTVIARGGFFGGDTPDHILGGDRYVAIGSSSGIVNIYDCRAIASQLSETLTSTTTNSTSSSTTPTTAQTTSPSTLRPKPLRTLENLTTPTSHLAFHPSGQILCMASRWKKNALRLVHLPSCTVYKNWPTDKTPLGRISSVAWSAEGRYLAVGNERGAVRLFEVRD